MRLSVISRIIKAEVGVIKENPKPNGILFFVSFKGHHK